MPTKEGTKTSTPLTQLMIRRMVNAKKAIANRLSPFVNVKKKSDFYYIFDDENTRIDDTAMDAEGGTNEVDFGWTKGYYLVNDYGLKKYIHPDLIDDSDKVIGDNIERAVSMMLTDKLILDRELRASNYFFNTTAMAVNSRHQALDNSTAFDNYNSDIVGILDYATEKVRFGSGEECNTIVMNKKVWKLLRRHPALLALLGDRDVKSLSLKQFAEILSDKIDLDDNVRILVAGLTYNSAKKGATPAFIDVWSDMCLFAYVNPDVNTVMENTFSKSFFRKNTGVQVSTYNHYDPDKGGKYVRAVTNYSFNRTNDYAGWLYSSVLKT